MSIDTETMYGVALILIAVLALIAMFGVRELYQRISAIEYQIFCIEHRCNLLAEENARMSRELENCVKEYVTFAKGASDGRVKGSQDGD